MRQVKETRLEDIAKELNISIVSVSNALNGKKGVGEELRQKVKEKARELGYQLPQSMTAKNQKLYQIGVMIAERYMNMKESASIYMDIYKHIALEASREDSMTSLVIIDDRKENLRTEVGSLINTELDGLVFIGETDIGFVRKIRESVKIPIVGIGFYDLNRTIDYVVTDDFHEGEQITWQLIQAGHKDIAFLGNAFSVSNITDCYMGYCKALRMNGLREQECRVIRENELETAFNLQEHMPTAFVVSDGQTAAVLIDRLGQEGLCVPENVSVAVLGYADRRISESVILTGYENNEKNLAQMGIHILKKRLENERSTERIWTAEACFVKGNTVKKWNSC